MEQAAQVSWGAVWVLVALAAIVFIVETAFLVVASAKKLRDAGLLEGELKLVVGFWLLIGWPCDVLFNWWRGSWMFRERPRNLTFSSRVGRMVNSSDWERRKKATRWATILNAADPGHVRMPD